MKPTLFQNKLHVKKSYIHGFGVFAAKDIRKGEKIEECYFILSDCEDDIIIDYLFEAGGRNALILGFGSIYNHSDHPNADYTFNLKRKVATFKASQSIKKGEEIFISYGDEWFKTREGEIEKKKPSPKKNQKRRKK